MEDLLQIQIPNWADYNPRSDRANYTWFRFENDFFSDPIIFGLSTSQQRLLVFVLCEASKANSDTVKLSPPLMAALLRCKAEEVQSDLGVLARSGLIVAEIEEKSAERRHDDGRVAASLPATNERTNERTNIVQFDFEKLYELYPRKQGKSPGMRVCKRHIRSQERYEALKSAIGRYVEHCTKKKLEPQFILLFSTFMNQWEDWLDPETGSVVTKEVKSIRPAGQEVPDAQATSDYLAKLEVAEKVSPERIRELCSRVVRRL